MEEDRSYLVPDYFPDFQCKMGACRHACCVGWPVTISMKDYFRLLSAPCSPELRRRIDCGLHLAPHPSPEGYAQICPRYDGQCCLRHEDGRCALQVELGEEALALVCRLYPRGIRHGDVMECSCANSCEALPEMFLHRTEPLTFITVQRAFPLPPDVPRQHSFHADGRELEIRLWLIRYMQDREYPLPQRLQRLGAALKALEQALEAHDNVRIDALLNGAQAPAAPARQEPAYEGTTDAIQALERMMTVVAAHSDNVKAHCEAALAYFGTGDEALDRIQAAREKADALVPQWDTWAEHMLVNHMYFVQFPFQDRPVSLRDEFIALCVVYMLLRFVCLGAAGVHGSVEAVVDAAAAVFRLTEHTTFDSYAAPLLRQTGLTGWEQLARLMCM